MFLTDALVLVTKALGTKYLYVEVQCSRCSRRLRFFVLVLANLTIYLHLSSFISAFILFSMHVRTNLFAAQRSKYILGHILLHAQTKVSMALFVHQRLETGAFAERGMGQSCGLPSRVLTTAAFPFYTGLCVRVRSAIHAS